MPALPLLAALVALTLPWVPVGAQERCPQASAADAEAGWEAYRAGDMPAARARFLAALALCPGEPYASTGLGYVALREGDRTGARQAFAAALAARPDQVDALLGMGILAWWDGARDAARDRFLRVLELDPDNGTALEYLARIQAGAGAGGEGGPADPADLAWRAGDVARAGALYAERLEADPDDTVALQRLGLVRAWAGRHAEALELFRRLLALEPDNLDAQVGRARIRAWSGELSAAIRDLAELLDAHPGYAPALEAMATMEGWAGRHDDALASLDRLAAVGAVGPDHLRLRGRLLMSAARFGAARSAYDSVLALDPDDGQALVGLGQVLSWGGRLVEGEAPLRRAVALAPRDVGALVPLAQNLRWQGRHPAARELLVRAEALAPANPDVREQRRWVDVALGPQLRPSVVLEGDSEDNRMVTSALTASVHPVPRLSLRADAYRRSLELGALKRDARGLTVSGSWHAEPGWVFTLGGGGSRSDGTRRPSSGAWMAAVASPSRGPVAATLTASSSALDVTAPLAERGVRVTEAAAAARWTPAPAWTLLASGGWARFRGDETNRRVGASVVAQRRVAAAWTVGGGLRALSFEKDLLEGYFDPDFLGVAELSLRWIHEPGRWTLAVEGFPALQQVDRDGDPKLALRGAARLGYRLAPGREVALSAGYSSAGLQSFATGASDYRYRALGVGASWVF